MPSSNKGSGGKMIKLNTESGRKIAKFAYKNKYQGKAFIDKYMLEKVNFDVNKYTKSAMYSNLVGTLIDTNKMEMVVKTIREPFRECQEITGSVYVFSPQELQTLFESFERELVQEIRSQTIQWGGSYD
jgi:hypothetical protein